MAPFQDRLVRLAPSRAPATAEQSFDRCESEPRRSEYEIRRDRLNQQNANKTGQLKLTFYYVSARRRTRPCNARQSGQMTELGSLELPETIEAAGFSENAENTAIRATAWAPRNLS